MARRGAVKAVAEVQEPRVGLADVIQMVREKPRHEPKRREPWTASRVEALPKAKHQMLAPIPEMPGACYQLVAEGAPVPPGADVLHQLTTEMSAAHERRCQYELRTQRIDDERRRLAELAKMEAEIARQRERAMSHIAELEVMEPVELFDWASVARQAWEVAEVDSPPPSIIDNLSVFPTTLVDRPGNQSFISGGPNVQYARLNELYR